MFKVSSLAALLACAALISGCDSKAPAASAEAPAPAAAPAAPPATPATVLAALDSAGVCDLFGRSMTTKDKEGSGSGCTAVAGEGGVTLTTADGATTLLAPFAVAGTTIPVNAANASTAAQEVAAVGGFTNVGMVFVGRAPAGGLCMQVEYFAPDGGSNSLYVWRIGEAVRVPFNLNKHETKTIETYFAEPVIPAGKDGAFSIYRRENGTVLKSVKFLDCTQVPPPEAN